MLGFHTGSGENGNILFYENETFSYYDANINFQPGGEQAAFTTNERPGANWRFDTQEESETPTNAYDWAGESLGTFVGGALRTPSSARLVQAVGLASGGAAVTVGPSGGTVQVVNTGPSDADPLAVYQYDTANGDLVEAGAPDEDFSDVGMMQRLNVAWDIEPMASSSGAPRPKPLL